MGNIGSSKLWPPPFGWNKKERHKDSKRKHSSRSLQKSPPVFPTYDTVTETPVYSVVNKSKQPHKKAEENLHYAEIEVIRHRQPRSSKQEPNIPTKPEATEYATINFPKEYNPVNGTLV
ncbi:hypothetical protein GDO86_012741 [Hymenochirus boettgeri]|uniref:Uncharacterized protein n=1 Tax=Hymenochirus boettgeri TaxID=247094 RepID=A0A8T2IWD1_9PIPI|nr:hypothetical protein GDO86_012741 [Hymenochirus boettgeri]